MLAAGISADRCDCAPGHCARFVEPPESCVSRLDGEVVTAVCLVCDPTARSAGWHHNGQCLRCAYRREHGDDPR